MRPLKIAVGGFQHETNTFAPHLAPFENFERADSWPPLTLGNDLYETMDGLNIPLSGFMESAISAGHQLHPLCWCSAEPSGYVTDDAFEKISSIICDGINSATDLDAVYLDLHGAMVTQSFEDGEGELLKRIRELVDPSIPVVISLDLHANVTEAMTENCDVMTIFRTYPHLDMAETGSRAFDHLINILSGKKYFRAMRKIPFLFSLPVQCTDFDPCRSIYKNLEIQEVENTESHTVDFATGFPPADIAECGAAIVSYANDQHSADQIADTFYQEIISSEAGFVCEMLDTDEAVNRAIQNTTNKPVILADAQDNPGAGGTSDTTGLLESLVRLGAQKAIIAVMYDPEVALQAHKTGVGNIVHAKLGAKSGLAGIEPFEADFQIETLGDGSFTFTGDMNLNAQAELGPMALLKVVDDHSEVRVIVGSTRAQCLDLAIIRHLGIEPSAQKIVAVKSSVHFRADFDPIGTETLVVISPGINPCVLRDLHYKNLRPGIRLEPMGQTHAPDEQT